MGDDNQRLDVSADREKTESKRVTSVMDGELFQELEEWRHRRGKSRSEAVSELVEDGLSDEQWTQKVKDAQDTLERAEVIAILTAAVAPDGDVNIRFESRDELEDDYPIGVGGGYESIAVGLYMLLDNYSQMLDVEVGRLLSEMLQLDEQTSTEYFGPGGGNE